MGREAAEADKERQRIAKEEEQAKFLKWKEERRLREEAKKAAELEVQKNRRSKTARDNLRRLLEKEEEEKQKMLEKKKRSSGIKMKKIDRVEVTEEKGAIPNYDDDGDEDGEIVEVSKKE